MTDEDFEEMEQRERQKHDDKVKELEREEQFAFKQIEAQAEEYINSIPSTSGECKRSVYSEEKLKQAYLDGLAEGRKERNCVNCSNHGKQFEVMKLEKQNAELKEQIEKMKCCGNCIYFMYGYCMTDESCHINNEYKKWELAE